MEHIEEKILELYVLEADEVKDKRQAIESHLNECAGCTALVEEMKNYYKEVDEIREQHIELSTKALTLRNMIVKIPPFRGEYKVQAIKMTLPARVVLFFLRNPIKSSVGFLALFLATLWLLLPTKMITDRNPDYAKAKDDFLIVYNKNGDDLWRRRIGNNFDAQYILRERGEEIPQNYYLNTFDIDNDGIKEVLVTFSYCLERNDKNKLYCFNANGSEKWVYEFKRSMQFGNEIMDDTYRIDRFIVCDIDKNGSKEILLEANHISMYPSCLVLLNAEDGKSISEYWHSGSVRYMEYQDFDNDNTEDVIIIGENNGYNLAFMSILDPRYLEGHSPAPITYIPINVKMGFEKYYLLFDRSDVGQFAYHRRNTGRLIRLLPENLLRIDVFEQFNNFEYGFILYYFNSNLGCVKVDIDDKFVQFRNKLVSERKLTGNIDERYLENLRRGIQYWDGEKFVNYPTMNKRYLEATHQKQLP